MRELVATLIPVHDIFIHPYVDHFLNGVSLLITFSVYYHCSFPVNFVIVLVDMVCYRSLDLSQGLLKLFLPDPGYLIPMCGICVHTVRRGRHSTTCQHWCEVPLDKGASHETVAAGHHHGPGQQVLDSASECTKTQEHNKKQAPRHRGSRSLVHGHT
jgi:hypothetical protein